MPVESWTGKCHEIAGLCLVAGITEGKLRYGLWHGPVNGRCGPPVHHGWVEVDPDPGDMGIELCELCPHVEDEHRKQGLLRPCQIEGCGCEDYVEKRGGARIFDPTRYVFEGKKPYIFDAEDDLGYYDVAGDRQRELTRKPLDEKIAQGDPLTLAITDLSTQLAIMGFLGERSSVAKPTKKGLRMPSGVAGWLANQPMSTLGPFAKALYTALKKAGLKGVIPIDCHEAVFGDGFYGQREKFEARIAKVMATESKRTKR